MKGSVTHPHSTATGAATGTATATGAGTTPPEPSSAVTAAAEVLALLDDFPSAQQLAQKADDRRSQDLSGYLGSLDERTGAILSFIDHERALVEAGSSDMGLWVPAKAKSKGRKKEHPHIDRQTLIDDMIKTCVVVAASPDALFRNPNLMLGTTETVFEDSNGRGQKIENVFVEEGSGGTRGTYTFQHK